MTKKQGLTGHLPGLDGVRGLAILMVMAIHFIGDSRAEGLVQRLVVKAAGLGLLGVDLFFVLSGFLITGLLLEAKGRPSYFRNFYARRTLRIFPLYYAVLAVLFLVLPLTTGLSPMLQQASDHQVFLWTYTTNFFIAARSSWSILSYVSHFWSLAIEEHFYLLWPLVVFSFRRETLERIALGGIVGGLLLRTVLSLEGVSELSISVLTPCRVDTLCVGALLAIVARREGGTEFIFDRAGRVTLALAGTILAVSAFGALTHLGLPVLHPLRGTLIALFFGALTVLSVRPGGGFFARVFGSPVLRFFGKYSYGLYVYHGLLTWYFIEHGTESALDSVLGSHALTMLVKAALGVAVSVLVAVASFELFEKRLLSFKRFFETREPATPKSLTSPEDEPTSRVAG